MVILSAQQKSVLVKIVASRDVDAYCYFMKAIGLIRYYDTKLLSEEIDGLRLAIKASPVGKPFDIEKGIESHREVAADLRREKGARAQAAEKLAGQRERQRRLAKAAEAKARRRAREARRERPANITEIEEPAEIDCFSPFRDALIKLPSSRDRVDMWCRFAPYEIAVQQAKFERDEVIILARQFGMTLAAIGKCLNIGRQRVRDIEDRALRRRDFRNHFRDLRGELMANGREKNTSPIVSWFNGVWPYECDAEERIIRWYYGSNTRDRASDRAAAAERAEKEIAAQLRHRSAKARRYIITHMKGASVETLEAMVGAINNCAKGDKDGP